jgi:hypothetical protein
VLSIPFASLYALLAPFKCESPPRPCPCPDSQALLGPSRRPLAAQGAGAGHAATPCCPVSVPAPLEISLAGEEVAVPEAPVVVRASRVVVVVTADVGYAEKHGRSDWA